MPRLWTTLATGALAVAAAAGCQSSSSAPRPPATIPGPTGDGVPGDGGGPPDGGPPPAQPGWTVAHAEDFSSVALPAPAWQPDPVPDDGPFSDNGLYFRNRGVVPPAAFRLSAPFGEGGWLTVESYTRDASKPAASLFAVADDPARAGHRVLRIASPAHTDATVIRSTQPLPDRYRISLKVGFANFGDGLPGTNGYRGGETAEPWWPDDATGQNGFYWLTILDTPPRPHNNTWIHHHRKVVVDSDNNNPSWMEMFDGHGFLSSGQHPVMLIALDGKGAGTECCGKPFRSFAGGQWQASGLIRAADAYLPGEWYGVSIERSEGVFTLEIAGRFRYGGQTTYRASIDAREACVWHFNRNPQEDASGCVDNSGYPSLGPGFPNWPADAVWPDYFMFGDPHVNYYEGVVYYSDVKLEVWK